MAINGCGGWSADGEGVGWDVPQPDMQMINARSNEKDGCFGMENSEG